MSKKFSSRSEKRPYGAKLASGEIRYYRSEAAARNAQKSSWVSHHQRRDGRNMERNLAVGPGEPRRDQAQSAYTFYNRTNRAEQTFLRFAASKSLRVHRNGWPDFFCETPQGRVAAIEVKSGADDPLRPEQVTCFKMLSEAGIKVFVWNKARSRKFDLEALIPWNEYVDGWLETDSSAKAAGKAMTSAESDSKLQAHATPAPEDGRIPEVLENPRTVH